MLEATFFHKSHRVPKPPVHKPSCSLKKKEHEIASGLNTIFRIDVSLLRPLTKKERANCTDVYIVALTTKDLSGSRLFCIAEVRR